MDTTIDIEKQLRDTIAASGQSLNQLGQAANVNDGQLSRFVRGERTLTLETVARLCKVLGLKFCPADAGGQADAKPSASKRPPAGRGEKPAPKKGEKRKG